MNIAGILHERALQLVGRPAIVERGRTISFAQLDRAAASAAVDLAAAGLAPGMRALVFAPMSIALYETMIGMFRLRVTAVFVDPSAGRERLTRCIERVRPDAFVAVRRAHLLGLTSAAIRSIPIKLVIGGGIPGVRAVSRGLSGIAGAVESCDPDTPAIITFTSGTTGEPKAAVRSHGFLLAQHQALVDSLGLVSGEVDLTTLPIFLLANLASGVMSVIPDADLRAPGAIDPAPVLEQIRQTRPSRIVASPAFLDRLAHLAAQRGERMDSFRRIYTGGAPVFPKLLDAIANVAPFAAVASIYGSTEAEPIAEIDRRAITPADRMAMQRGAGLLAGTPAPSIELRIMPDRWGSPVAPVHPDELDRAALATGEVGEIVVTGEHVLTGYLGGLGDEDTKIAVGDRVWHRTGDAGYTDPQGRLWLLGRCAGKVSDREGVLYPFAVECAAHDLAAVRRGAFVLHRERRVLAVELDPHARFDRQALMDRLAWAHLADVLVVPRIPVDHRHNAKVDLAALRLVLEKPRFAR